MKPFASYRKNRLYDDYVSGYRTPEPAFYAFSSVDNATLDMYNESAAMPDRMTACGMMYDHGVSVGLSVKTLIHRGTDGILVAGKGWEERQFLF